MRIRRATSDDLESIRQVHLRAFTKAERDRVSRLAVDLSTCDAEKHDILSLVAESTDAVVGHVAVSPVKIADNPNRRACILAPLGVVPPFQNCGVGGKLVTQVIHRLRETGVEILFVYGDPAYYGRFGFKAEAALEYAAPYKLEYPHGWQAIVLDEGISSGKPGRVTCVPALCDPALW